MAAIGSPVTVFTCTTTPAAFDVAFQSATLALVAYHVTGGSFTNTSAVTLSINPSTYAVTVNTPVSASSNGQGVTLHTIPGTTNVVAVWYTAATTITGSIISISGTVPTFNALATITVTAANLPGSLGFFRIGLGVSMAGDVCYVGSTAAATPFDSSYSAFAISGTTLTAGGTVVDFGYSGPSNTGSGQIDEIAPNQIMCLQLVAISSNQMAFGLCFLMATRRPVSIFGNQMGAGWPVPVSEVSISAYDYQFRSVDGNGIGVVMYSNFGMPAAGSTVAAHLYLGFFRKRKGGTQNVFDFGDAYDQLMGLVGACPAGGLCVLPTGTVIATAGQSTSSGTAGIIIAIRRHNNILGIAIDGLGTIQRTGIVSGLSGLTPGMEYGVDDSGALTTVVGDTKIGKALSATKMALQVIPGV